MAKKKEEKRKKQTHKIVFASVLTVLVIAMIVSMVMPEKEEAEKAAEEKAQEEAPVEEEKVSFAEYLDNIDLYRDSEVTLKGYLRLRVEQPTEVVYYELVDDFDNAILLSKMDSAQRHMFTENPVVKHEVTGTIKASWSNVFINVRSIS